MFHDLDRGSEIWLVIGVVGSRHYGWRHTQQDFVTHSRSPPMSMERRPIRLAEHSSGQPSVTLTWVLVVHLAQGFGRVLEDDRY